MAEEEKKRASYIWPLVIFGAVIILILLAWIFGFERYFTFHNIAANQEKILDLVHNHPVLAPLIFVASFALAETLALPIESIMSLISGYLFSQPFATIYTVIGATLGGFFLFLIARSALHSVLKRRKLTALRKMEAGFNKNAASYLLFLRFIPIFPFWIVNLAAALFDVKMTTFLWTTVVGLIPLAFIHAEAGRGLEHIFLASHFSFREALNPQMRIALVALALLSLVPILVKKILERLGR